MSLTPADAEALAACSREPIHIPGAIQPHGVLLALARPEFTCVQISANAATVFARDPAELLGRKITELVEFPPEVWAAALEEPTLASPLTARVGDQTYDALLHRSDGLLLMELEPVSENFAVRYHRRLQATFAAMRAASDLPALYQICAEFIATITGYERVMVYRFDQDWHGEVVGEHLSAKVDSYAGHHFPASDIPEQARALYARSWLRIIPNSTYTPVPLVPELNPQTQRPLDLSGSTLRSVSPIHLQYLRNMDVGASMSISLLVDGKLWGLIACHHREARPLSYAVRAACELFGQVASLEISAQQEARRLAEHVQTTAIQTRFFDILANEQNVMEALVRYTPYLLEFMSATGAVICVNEKITQLGTTPPRTIVESLIARLPQLPMNPVFATDSLSSLWPEAATCKDIASGLLAVRLSQVEHNYVLWFRPEVVSTVTWAGNPTKPVDDAGSLHPRTSFAAWTEEVTGHSLAWREAEIQGARELRTALNALVLRRNQRLMQDNADLEKKNTDLNSFAYIASHDLKEPLRGIANYSNFLREDHGAALPAEAVRRLEKINALATRSEGLLDSLNRFSKLGRMEITTADCDLDQVLDEVLENLGELIRLNNVDIRRAHPLPHKSCDAVLIREVLANLIANAIRYNRAPDKWVEIGVRTDEDTAESVLYVRDNGIGIREKHIDAIFTMFRRLHAFGEYGDGSGAGLAIARNIVERHGGHIWVESTYGEGSTFLFTLP